jgi:hypothetical protein
MKSPGKSMAFRFLSCAVSKTVPKSAP